MLNVEARADLEWWFQFGLDWNGNAMMNSLEIKVGATDGSGV